MRILLISDTHGNGIWKLRDIIEKANKTGFPYDQILHMGDLEGDENKIGLLTDAPLVAVRGNCDVFANLPDEIITEVAGKKILMVHGHRHMVRSGPQELVAAAKEVGADYAFYGHTHVPFLQEIEGVVVANPGSLCLPRNEKGASFMVMDVDSGGEIHLTLNYLRDWDYEG